MEILQYLLKKKRTVHKLDRSITEVITGDIQSKLCQMYSRHFSDSVTQAILYKHTQSLLSVPIHSSHLSNNGVYTLVHHSLHRSHSSHVTVSVCHTATIAHWHFFTDKKHHDVRPTRK